MLRHFALDAIPATGQHRDKSAVEEGGGLGDDDPASDGVAAAGEPSVYATGRTDSRPSLNT